MPASILTTTRLKSLLGIAAGVTFHDTALGYAADAAEDYVKRGLGQSSWSVTTTNEYPEVYDEGQVEVILKHTPVVSIGVVTNGDYAVAAADYRLDTDNGLIRLKGTTGYWSTDRDGVIVQYGWGYTSSTLPEEVVRAMEIIACADFNTTPKGGMKSMSQSGYSHTLTDADIPPAARAILARYFDVHHA